MPIESYDNLNCLPEISFTAGATISLLANAYKENGATPLGITGGGYMTISEYGNVNPSPVLGITGIAKSSTSTSFTIAGQTGVANLSGKYIYQIMLIDTDGKHTVQQGTMLISPSTS